MPECAAGESEGPLILNDREGREIRDWRNWPRPKRDYQWAVGRSAMELARAWFTSSHPVCPPEVRALLETHGSTRGIELSHGRPEHVTGLPESGEGRNHDLLLFGRQNGLPVVLSVEAKVDETFGERLGRYWKRARRNGKSRAPHRVENLLAAIFGAEARPDESPWEELRYQLLTAVAGTAIEAARAGADIGIVVIHELHTSMASRRKLAKNAAALAEFLRVAGLEGGDMAGRLHGPVRVAAKGPISRPVDVFIGRAIYDWDERPDEQRLSPVGGADGGQAAEVERRGLPGVSLG